MTIVCEAPEHAAAPHPRLALQARDHRRRRRGRPRRSRRPRALPHQGRRRPQLAPRPPLALADLRARQRLPCPRRRPRSRIHHARDDRLLLQDRRPPPGPPRDRLQVLEVSRTGRMAMRRGHHTGRVLKALGSKADEPQDAVDPRRPSRRRKDPHRVRRSMICAPALFTIH